MSFFILQGPQIYSDVVYYFCKGNVGLGVISLMSNSMPAELALTSVEKNSLPWTACGNMSCKSALDRTELYTGSFWDRFAVLHLVDTTIQYGVA